MNYGFVRCGVAVPQLKVADCQFNAEKILELVQMADNEQVQLLVFPELCLTAYTCGDLFYQKRLRDDAENALFFLLEKTAEMNIGFIVGMPVFYQNALYNVAVVCQKGEVLGLVPKTHLPNNQEFYEKRWFSSGINTGNKSIFTFSNDKIAPIYTDLIFRNKDFAFGIELCEDLWTPSPPSAQLAMHGADIICNLSASNELIGKHLYRKTLVEQQSARCNAGYLYASAGMGESTQDLVFSGAGFIVENGTTLAETERFSLENQLIISEIDVEKLRAERIKNSNFNNLVSEEIYNIVEFDSNTSQQFPENQGIAMPVPPKRDKLRNDVRAVCLHRKFNPHPFVPSKEKITENCEEIFNIQTGGLIKRWQHTHCKTLVIGISGGLDSTLALLVCVKTADLLGYDRKRIIGITMPGFGTTKRTHKNAVKLMETLGVTAKEISIKDACIQHFKDIEHDIDIHDVVYENTQARERTQILMDIANKENGLVVGTGDLSELALGCATYNGDHISMYGVNSGVPKTLVRYLVAWVADTMSENVKAILDDILDTPVSPELLPVDNQGKMTQFTENVIGNYELHDFFLYYFVRFGFSPEKIFFLAQNAFADIYSAEVIKKWLKVFLRRFFSQQFKRSCMPDGPKVGSINLSPRGDWRMPSDAAEFEFI
ncbi:MAG: NAD(+) synthase [Paludibacter sp.]|jgi:NAD+ synthase (glutamine-hydrolysing)|nr:NAD(+) synthase [Paludibacter sp.]